MNFLRPRRNRRKRKPVPARYTALGSALLLVLSGAAVGWVLRGTPESAPSPEERPTNEWAGLGTLPRIEMPDFELPDLPDLRAALRRDWLRVEQVDVYGLEHIARGEIDARAGLADRPALVDVDPALVCERISELPRVADCSCVRLPQRVVLRITERRPIARLGTSLRAVDADGTAFPVLAEEAESLTTVRGKPRGSLSLLRAAREADLAIAEVDVRSESEVRFRPARSALWVITGRWPERALHVWRTVQTSDALSDEGLAEVDLRFEGHVVLRNGPRPRQEVEDGTS